MSQITDVDARKVVNAIKQLPHNRSKSYPKLSTITAKECQTTKS
ncbi:MAG: hypothetical protein VX830_08895 [Candidatus Poribacteria bacterium]|nr:hypothetical protein [Candidatus Poribacteria bacterium]